MEDGPQYQNNDAPGGTLNTGQPKITGYRNLSQGEIAAMNSIKEIENQVGELVHSFDGPVPGGNGEGAFFPDPRWLAIARTTLQQGFMALSRAVAQPTSMLNPPVRTGFSTRRI